MDEDDTPRYEVTDEDILSLLSTTRRYEAEAAMQGILAEERNRLGFWLSTLESSKTHLVVKSIAEKALQAFGVK